MFRPGSWCDVCVLPDGRIAFVRVDGTFTVCEIDGAEAWRVDAKVSSLFLRCAALADGTVAAIVKANDAQGSALLILRNTVMNLGPTAGNNPVALTATHAYVVTASDKAHRISLADGAQEPVTIRWTGQGIRDVLPNGTVIFGDDTLGAQIKGYNFGEYQVRGDLTVGQHANGIGVLLADHFFVARSGPVNFGVHGAQSGSRIAICAFTEGGSYYQEFAPPYPAGPVVTPPPPPPPPPPPKGDTMTIPQPIYDTLNAVAAKFFDMHASSDDNVRREAMKRGIQTVRARHAGQATAPLMDGSRWVCKSEHATGWSAASKDAAGYVEPQYALTDGAQVTMHIFDTISGSTHRMNPSPLAEVGPPAPSPRTAYALIPEPFDWLADVSPPPPPPPNTHLYDGGENDTGTCDICHLSRFDPVHVTAESTVKHAYNGGEQDTGQCDICQKPPDDPIHDLSPQQPPGGTPSPGGTVSLDDDATQLLTQILDSCHAQEERQAEIVAAVQELKDAVGSTGKSLTGEIVKNAPGILSAILPFLKGSAVKKPAAKRKRR